MKVSSQEENRAKHLLQSRQIKVNQIESFCFMKRPLQDDACPSKKKYGPGILTLHLKGEKQQIVLLPPCRHPSSMIRFLISQDILFRNYEPKTRTAESLPAETFSRPSLYMFYFFVLFLAFLILGYYLIGGEATWRFVPAAGAFGLSLLLISTLMTRFCYVSLNNDSLTVHSVGRSITYPYKELRKVNFDFAREQTFTHIMELLDKDYRYRLFYIGRVPRTKLNEIAQRLQQAGVDATCSLNESKRFYEDTHFRH